MATHLPLGSFSYFGSNASGDMKKLSNFFACPVRLTRADLVSTPVLSTLVPDLSEWLGADGLVFPSSEHLWQALKARNAPTLRRFAVGGDLAILSPGLFQRTTLLAQARKVWRGKGDTIVSLKKLDGASLKKVVYWEKRGVGIAAKLASKEAYGQTLELGPEHMDYARETLAPDVERAIWLLVLRLKFEQNPALGDLLLSTQGHTLVEFDKAGARLDGPVKVKWGAYVDPTTHCLRGQNVMGTYLMATRDILAGNAQ